MFNFLIAKYYQKQLVDKDEDPILRTFVYAGSLLTAFWFAIFLPFIVLTERTGFIDKNNSTLEILIFCIGILLIVAFLYLYLIRNRHLDRIVRKYGHHQINRTILNVVLFFSILLLFFVGPTVTVLLFGGTILEQNFTGILTPYLH